MFKDEKEKEEWAKVESQVLEDQRKAIEEGAAVVVKTRNNRGDFKLGDLLRCLPVHLDKYFPAKVVSTYPLEIFMEGEYFDQFYFSDIVLLEEHHFPLEMYHVTKIYLFQRVL